MPGVLQQGQQSGKSAAPVRASRFRMGLVDWIVTIVAAAIVIGLAVSLSSSPNMHWGVFRQYFTARIILSGIVVTIVLTLLSSLLGLLVGVLLAVMSECPYKSLRAVARAYIWCARGTPVLVHLLLWFNLALFFPTISIGIPFVHTFWSVPTNTVITSFTASVLGLSLSEAAYMAEIVRGGLKAVPGKQQEAAKALGLTAPQTFFLVLFPQAMRAMLPPLSNQIILMLKTTSLVSVIAGNDLLTRVKDIYSDNFEIVPLLLVATVWYLIFASITTLLQGYLERRYSKGYAVQSRG
ncbi:amino acid ABC transporter permease [Achromobacter aloeverae]